MKNLQTVQHVIETVLRNRKLKFLVFQVSIVFLLNECYFKFHRLISSKLGLRSKKLNVYLTNELVLMWTIGPTDILTKQYTSLKVKMCFGAFWPSDTRTYVPWRLLFE